MSTQQTLDQRIQDFRLKVYNNIGGSINDVKEISISVTDYMEKLAPDFKLGTWEFIPAFYLEFVKCCHSHLRETFLKLDVDELVMNIGNCYTQGIQYARSYGGEKEGSLNPVIRTLDELQFGRSVGDVTSFKGGLDSRWVFDVCSEYDTMEKICKDTLKAFEQEYGVPVSTLDWGAVLFISISFVRELRNFLEVGKKKEEYYEIMIGPYITFELDTTVKGDKFMCVLPGQEMKTGTKGDGVTENE